MNFTVNVEYELTKEKVYDEGNEVIEEYTFIVPAAWLYNLYYNHIIKIFDYKYHTLDEFLDIYDCEIEGTVIYCIAKSQGRIIEEGWAEVAEN